MSELLANTELVLDDVETARLLSVVDEGARVHRRHQFFIWTQGRMQGFIPHGMLICGVGAEAGGMMFDCFYNFPVEPDTIARLCNTRDGLALELLDQWLLNQCEPYALDDGVSVYSPAIASQARALGFGEVMVHGIPSSHGRRGAVCMFAFASQAKDCVDERERTFVRLLTPQIFGAYSRVLFFDRPTATLRQLTDPELAVTEREVEILGWIREGKSNLEIGMILNISPLTVKNHVQKILRKLQSTNRAQAVSKAIALRLLGPSRPRVGAASEEVREEGHGKRAGNDGASLSVDGALS